MAKQQFKGAALKKKKKKWVSILATKEFNNMEIGESLIEEPTSLINRTLRLSLGAVTNKMRLQYIQLTFVIKQIKENKALTEIIKYSLIPSYVKRIVKSGRSKIAESFTVNCKDNIKIRVKPIIITKAKINRGILTTLRKKSIEVVKQNLEKNTYDQNLSNLINHSFQKELKETLKKITPLGSVEIRSFEKIK